MEIHLNALTEVAKKAALDAGHAIMELYDSSEYETKTDGSPVTVADLRANEIIIKQLNETGIPILSEESEGIGTPYPDLLWIIDPIDGTSGFVKSDGDFAVMIGLLKEGKPVLGVVYAPAFDELFVGAEGQGAYLEKDGTKHPLTLQEIGEPVRLVHTRNHLKPHFAYVAKELQADSVSRGGIGIKITILLKNEGDIFFSLGDLADWDICAPHAIYAEIGGTVTDCVGGPLTYGASDHHIEKGALFAHPDCHADALKAIIAHGNESA